MANEQGFEYDKEFRNFASWLSFDTGPHFDDVYMECWVAYLSLEQLRDKPRPYFLAAIYHKVIDAMKKQRYYKDYDGKFLHISIEEVMRCVSPDDWPAELIDWESSEVIDENIDAELIMARLDSGEQDLLYHRFFLGMHQKDIAVGLEVTRAAVSKRLKRILETLRLEGAKL